MSARTSEGHESAGRILRGVSVENGAMDIKRMRAQVIACHLLHRLDTSALDKGGIQPVGACCTHECEEGRTCPRREIRDGISTFEIVVWFLAGFLTLAVISPDLFIQLFKAFK